VNARDLLARHGLRAKKSWGQNFLVDPTVLARIVAAAEVGNDDVAVEIGAGLGALTLPLAAAAGKVIAVERDPELVTLLGEVLAGKSNVDISATDALTFDFGAAAAVAGRPLVVLGNLPYQITSPLLFGITDGAERGRVIARAVLMVQRELAERATAPPGSKTYGRLSVMVQQQAEVALLFHVGAHAFYPRPEVTSTVLRLRPRAHGLAPVRDRALFAAVVRAAFGARRKMLRGALAQCFGETASRRGLSDAGIDETRRAEELAVAEFARIADALADIGARASTGDA